MKYIKLFEDFNKEREVEEEVIKYVVKFDLVEGSSDPIEIVKFDELEEAQEYFNDVFEWDDDARFKTREHSKSLDKVIYNVTYSYNPDEEDKEDIDDEDKEWEIEDYENIDYDTYSINNETDTLLEEVESWFKDEYRSNDWKYHTINVDYLDEDGDEDTKRIQVRFSDHTENINNIDRYGRPDYHISVVMSNYDVTKDRFWSNKFERYSTEYELKYSSEDSIDSIKDEISELISNIKEEIKEKNKG